MAAAFTREARQSAELVARLSGELGPSQGMAATDQFAVHFEVPRAGCLIAVRPGLSASDNEIERQFVSRIHVPATKAGDA
jgi:hypothetical protein